MSTMVGALRSTACRRADQDREAHGTAAGTMGTLPPVSHLPHVDGRLNGRDPPPVRAGGAVRPRTARRSRSSNGTSTKVDPIPRRG